MQHDELSKAGYVFDEAQDVWKRENYTGIGYTDGDGTEERIAQAIASCDNVSVLSDELRHHCVDWPSLYHLSASRANLLRPFEHLLKGDILEIGAGCGALTRYLGECGGNVLALEAEPRRAQIARARCRNLPNVTTVADTLASFPKDARYDVVTLIGVLEYAGVYSDSATAHADMLAQARERLRPNGLLILAIENQLGLKYLAGAAEDHLGVEMYGVENHYRRGDPTTFGRRRLKQLLKDAGFGASFFYAPFPDYKLPTSVISGDGLIEPDFDAAALICPAAKNDPQQPERLAFAPEMAWRTITGAGLAMDLANSFLVAAMASPDNPRRPLTDNCLAWHFNTIRRAAFCKQTWFVKEPDGHIVVHAKRLADATYDAPSVVQNIEPVTAYIVGAQCSERIGRLIAHDNWKLKDLGEALTQYLAAVTWIMTQDGHTVCLTSPDTPIDRQYIDLIPQNIIMDSGGGAHVIDREWASRKDITIGFVLFRALVNLIDCVSHVGERDGEPFSTRAEFIAAAFSSLGWRLEDSKLDEYVEAETLLQGDVLGRAPDVSMLQGWLRSNDWRRSNIFREYRRMVQAYEARLACATSRADHLNSDLSALHDRERLLLQELELARNQLAETSAALANACASRVVAEQSAQTSESRALVLERSLRELRDEVGRVQALVPSLKTRAHQLQQQVDLLLASRSWRVTAPLRGITRPARSLAHFYQLALAAARRSGGWVPAMQKALRISIREGSNGLRARFRRLDSARMARSASIALASPVARDVIIPHYVDPSVDQEDPEPIESCSLACHLHLHHLDLAEEFIERLARIPVRFDLFVSISTPDARSSVEGMFRRGIPNIGELTVECTPNRGRNFAPLIVTFGKRLRKYDVIGHFHSKKSPRATVLANWRTHMLDALLGPPGSSGGRIAVFVRRLMTDVKMIYPPRNPIIIQDESGWADNQRIAGHVLHAHTDLSIETFPKVSFPEGGMFWARGSCLRQFLELPLTYGDFPPEPIPPDGTLAHALERLVAIFAHQTPGAIMRVEDADSIADHREYEPQIDFRARIASDDIRILAYYLPQFHRIPENDAWHGEGFTEWTKVRAANPLFVNHYQQHIPHPDIGYYTLDTPDTLRKQAEMLRAAGLGGMVFYHYWFHGRMILHEPAEMLLAHPDIDMPFCFCWANENWTRRWDGNEREILLEQTYSRDDARAFIQRLIPFFRDPRHLRVGERPVLFVYRPADIPAEHDYPGVWRQTCCEAGVPAPYVVAVLTRGARDPRDYGMDAGCERPLHDWTGGAAPDIRDTLEAFAPMRGSALNYDDVVEHHVADQAPRPFTWLRSVLPTFDNTARYGAEAFLTHGATPRSFQRWLEKQIEYTRAHLPADRRFIVVNAWNEWAEGAHLEPDSRYGYAWLNSVGRSLAALPYESQLNATAPVPPDLVVHIALAEPVRHAFRLDPSLKERMLHVVRRSTLLGRCRVTMDDDIADQLNGRATPPESPEVRDFHIELRRPSLFGPRMLEMLVETALAIPGATVSPNAYYDHTTLPKISANGGVLAHEAWRSPVIVYPQGARAAHVPFFRIRTDAHCVEHGQSILAEDKRPSVTTIVRIHHDVDIELLRKSLGCLAAMRDCRCIPLIAAQDVPLETLSAVHELLNDFPWYDGHEPVVKVHHSPTGLEDLRSVTLNESFRSVSTRYVGVLDYDDLLMPSAYSWLIDRLQHSGKAVAFGRVFATDYAYATGVMLQRRRSFEYGVNYADFLKTNHAPIHSFLIDLSRISNVHVNYHEDQIYMEDYYLTLQIFNEHNCDWASLTHSRYIGDYIHGVDRRQTLAIRDDERSRLLQSRDYQRDEMRIQALKLRLLGKNDITSVASAA